MVLEKKPFRDYSLEEKKDKRERVLPVWLNLDDQEMLKQAQVWLQQEKEGTAFKQLALLGYAFLTGEHLTGKLRDILFKNARNNKRLGIVEVEKN